MSENKTTCRECGHELEIGEYPFCPHGQTREYLARRFDPIVVHRNIETGEYSYPSHSSDPVEAGYEKIELSSIQQADRFVREVESVEREKRQLNIHAEKQYWDQRTKDRREKIKAEMERRGIRSSRVFDMVKEYIDRNRERKYSRMMNKPVNFHIDVFSRDSSNRTPYSGPETGWRDRKS